MWKEAGTGIALVGFVLALFAFAGLLLRARLFAPLAMRTAPAAGATGIGWWLAALIAAAVPVATYFWATAETATYLEPSRWLPQNETTKLMGWALLNGAISALSVLLWYVLAGRRSGARSDTLGLRVGGFGRAITFGLAVVGAAYGLLALSQGAFGTDFRLWVVAVKLLSPEQLRIAAIYLLPFTAFFVTFGMVLHAQLRPKGAAAEGADAMVANALIAGGGFVVLLLVQYLALFSGQPLPFRRRAAVDDHRHPGGVPPAGGGDAVDLPVRAHRQRVARCLGERHVRHLVRRGRAGDARALVIRRTTGRARDARGRWGLDVLDAQRRSIAMRSSLRTTPSSLDTDHDTVPPKRGAMASR
jgi:hypothetical protein